MARSTMKRTKPTPPRLSVYALAYPVPEDSSGCRDTHTERGEGDVYAYYSPTRSLDHELWADRAFCLSERFLYTGEPLSWQELEAARLVPANLHTRLQLALAYDQPTCQEIPMIWTSPRGLLEDGGDMLAWYPEASLWGATGYAKREGREGTIFARTREPLVAAALRRGYIPHPFLLEGVQKLPGMQAGAIEPVFLARTTDDPLYTALLTAGVQAVTNRDPWLVLEGRLPEWVVSLLCEDRHMAYSYASAGLPTLEQVVWHLLAVARATDRHPGGEWVQVAGNSDEPVPYAVCLRQAQEVKAVLGSAYSMALALFQDRAQGLLAADPAHEGWCMHERSQSRRAQTLLRRIAVL